VKLSAKEYRHKQLENICNWISNFYNSHHCSRFGVAVTAFVTSTKLSYVEPG